MEWLINRRRMLYNKPVPPVYIPFEDNAIWERVCCLYGDYNETVITDNGDNTVDIVVTFKSMLNTTLKKSKVISSESNVDNTGGEYTPGTTKTAVGMTLKQCAAVTSIGTIFKNNTAIRKFNEFQYFTKITSLSNGAFESSGIAEITFPSSLETIGGNSYADVFWKCTNLTSLILNEGVTFVGDRWIWGSGNIVLLDFPSTISTMSGLAIQTYGGTSQNSYNIICRATNPPALGSSNYLTKLVKVYVPDDSVDAYKAASKWGDFATKIVGLSTYAG